MTADRDALLDLLGAIEAPGPHGEQWLGNVLDAAARNRRHVDRTDYALPGSVHDTGRAQSILRRLGLIANAATTPVLVEAFAAVREEGRERGVRPFRDLFSGGPDTPCRTTWHDEPVLLQGQEALRVEHVEVPLDDLRAAFVEAGEPA